MSGNPGDAAYHRLGTDVNAKDGEGWTALILAARRGHGRMVARLLRAYATQTRELLSF